MEILFLVVTDDAIVKGGVVNNEFHAEHVERFFGGANKLNYKVHRLLHLLLPRVESLHWQQQQQPQQQQKISWRTLLYGWAENSGGFKVF